MFRGALRLHRLHTSLPTFGTSAAAQLSTSATRNVAPLAIANYDLAYVASELPQPRYSALLLDATGTLISPSEPTAEVYLRFAEAYGCTLTEREILHNFRRAYNAPWDKSVRRYMGDARPFWEFIVAESTGCDDAALSEELYQYFARAQAWEVAPNAVPAISRVREAGVKCAVVSNFDTRLRPLLISLGLADHFDAIIVSAEVGAEKPNPVIFEAACQALAVAPCETVHVGDDRRNDVFGARDAGCFAWLWGVDVFSLDEVADRVLYGDEDDDELRAIAQ